MGLKIVFNYIMVFDARLLNVAFPSNINHRRIKYRIIVYYDKDPHFLRIPTSTTFYIKTGPMFDEYVLLVMQNVHEHCILLTNNKYTYHDSLNGMLLF